MTVTFNKNNTKTKHFFQIKIKKDHFFTIEK